MKTYEELFETNSIGSNVIALSEREFNIVTLDAYKAGMTRAAEIVKERYGYSDIEAAGEAILVFRDNLKEIPNE